MKIVRKHVFETNSSSTHSISLSTEDQETILDTIYPDENGVITVKGKEFGWDWTKFNDAETKLAYLFQDAPEHYHDHFKEVIMKQTGATEVIFDDKDGYIDHGGQGCSEDARYDVRNFVFNKNSWLFTGNDNAEAEPAFYFVPEYKGDKIIEPLFVYELVIDGLKRTTKFIKHPTNEEIETAIDFILDHALLADDGTFNTDSSIGWQINRTRNFYEKSWSLEQDYSKREIVFLKENDDRAYDIEKEVEEDPQIEGLNYTEVRRIKTQRFRDAKELTKTVKFVIKEI